ncbi:helix-turn-helix transcriptional regulator [Roseateles sp. NT4]|uniref:helix-turn-helix transcriptional regulator n=1 Tax=Roseateles sp. NT4 TaxID=3453715 RepID=UPI003EEB739B
MHSTLQKVSFDTSVANDPILLRLPRVCEITGLGRSTIYRMMAADLFPKQIQLGARAIGWRFAEILGWCEARPTSSLATSDAMAGVRGFRTQQSAAHSKPKRR